MRDFITTILGNTQGNAVMSLATGRNEQGKLEINYHEWFKYPEELDKMVEFAEKKRSGDRRNSYISPLIYGDQKNDKGQPRRTIENAIMSNTVYMDSDLCPPDKFRLTPSVHLRSSEANGQDYWILSEPVTAEQASEAAHKITIAHKNDGCDPSGWAQNKVLRLPAFNTKDPKNVWEVTWENSGHTYDIEDLQDAYSDIELAIARPKKPTADVVRSDAHRLAESELPDRFELSQRIPATERNVSELLFKKPRIGEKGWRSQQLFSLCLELFRLNFEPAEVVSLCWGAPAASKWREDQRGLDGLWNDVLKAKGIVDAEREAQPAPEPSVEATFEPIKPAEPIKLLTDDERESIDGHWSMVTEYLAWAESQVPVFNRPYHVINAWTLISAGFSDIAFLPKKSKPMGVNIYSMQIGESSSGKTEASDLMHRRLDALFGDEDSPKVGANTSENALIEVLLERDGKVSLISDDEADKVLGKWKKADGWASGVQQVMTQVYDGKVPQLNRVGKKELRKPNAKGYVISHMIGTPTGMYKVLDEDMFTDGYLARHIWGIGETIPISKESMKTDLLDGTEVHEYDLIPSAWAEQIQHIRKRMVSFTSKGNSRVAVMITEEAAERLDEAKWENTQHLSNLGNAHIFTTASRRLSDIMMKVCALQALSDGERIVTVRHVLIALSYIEEWVESLKQVAENIASSVFGQSCDEIERFIASSPRKRVTAFAVYSFKKNEPPRKVEEYLDSLQVQHRIKKVLNKNDTTSYSIVARKERENDDDTD